MEFSPEMGHVVDNACLQLVDVLVEAGIDNPGVVDNPAFEGALVLAPDLDEFEEQVEVVQVGGQLVDLHWHRAGLYYGGLRASNIE